MDDFHIPKKGSRAEPAISERGRYLVQLLSDVTNATLRRDTRERQLEALADALALPEQAALVFARRARREVGPRGGWREWLRAAGWLDSAGREFLPGTSRLVTTARG